jgi:hypothetical protein
MARLDANPSRNLSRSIAVAVFNRGSPITYARSGTISKGWPRVDLARSPLPRMMGWTGAPGDRQEV